jgi:hypothetical protein
MKGITEVEWVLLLILIGGIIAFLVIVGFTQELEKKLVSWITNFKASDLVNAWQKVLSNEGSH